MMLDDFEFKPNSSEEIESDEKRVEEADSSEFEKEKVLDSIDEKTEKSSRQSSFKPINFGAEAGSKISDPESFFEWRHR